MSLHLSATTGEAISPAQLLGEEAADTEARTVEAGKSMDALMKKMEKVNLLPGQPPAPKTAAKLAAKKKAKAS